MASFRLPFPEILSTLSTMFIIDQIILAAGVLILAGILSSKLSARIGLPVLVLFLFVGMVAGVAGLGGLVDAQVSHALGRLARALILFDGCLQTSHAAKIGRA